MSLNYDPGGVFIILNILNHTSRHCVALQEMKFEYITLQVDLVKVLSEGPFQNSCYCASVFLGKGATNSYIGTTIFH